MDSGISERWFGLFFIISGALGTWSLGLVGGLPLAVGILSIAAAEKNTKS
ncbi:MAG: hypothetical protein GKC03_10025 [Methanomassiliicoccales archaeon]|nr:hypothetical protein [Methanomassiliicoccales archaeon]NYT16184.1 hypothetical protein [Methanomassiliicoccales archaeon]